MCIRDRASVGPSARYTLAVATVPSDKAAAVVLNPKPSYDYGELVTVEVTCDPGYAVTYWGGAPGNVQGGTTRITFPMTGDEAITAYIGLDTSPGNVVAWGDNFHGQLGVGTYTDSLTAIPVASLSNVRAVCAGWNHSMALRQDGSVVACGNNDCGQCGDGSTEGFCTPYPVSGFTGAYSIAGGEFHSLASDSNGDVRAWGRNHVGQLGDGTTTDHLTPVTVSLPGMVLEVAAGSQHSAALQLDGTVWTWGAGLYGQLGDNTFDDRHAPIQVHGVGNVGLLGGIVHVGCGAQHTAALGLDGTVRAWGRNHAGQVGDGTTSNRYVPVQVSGLADVRQLAVGGYHGVALKHDGTVWAWGLNNHGQCGNNTTANCLVPVQVLGPGGFGHLENIVQVGAGWDHSFAVDNFGLLYCWGFNGNGQLGEGSTTDRLLPMQSSCPPGVVRVCGGRDHSWALFGPMTTETLTTTVSPPGTGTVTRTPDWAGYDPQQPVVLEAIAASGYEFSHWSGETNLVMDPSAAKTAIFMHDSWAVTAHFVEEQAELLEVAAAVAPGEDWVYQNAYTTTQNRHRSTVTVSLVSEAEPGETYTVSVADSGPGGANFFLGSVVDNRPGQQTLSVPVLGGSVGGSTPGAGGAAYTVTLTVEGQTSTETDTADVSLVLRYIGDVDGSGSPGAQDKQYFNQRLNGVATAYPDRCYDLNGSGGAPNAEDKQVMNQVLNGVSLP